MAVAGNVVTLNTGLPQYHNCHHTIALKLYMITLNATAWNVQALELFVMQVFIKCHCSEGALYSPSDMQSLKKCDRSK